MNVPTDRDLLAAFIERREEGAFCALVERHQALVWTVCQRMLPCHQDREDVFQATFLKLVVHGKRNRWNETIAGWLYRVACNLSRKTLAKRKKWLDIELIDPPVDEANRLEAIQRHEAELALHAALLKLPKNYREAIILCYFHKKSHQQAAAEIGCSPNALHGRLQRGRRSLLSHLSRQGAAFSFILLALEQTLQAAQQTLPSRVVEQTTEVGVAYLTAGDILSSSAQVNGLCKGEFSAMLRSGIPSKFLATVSCSVLFCCGLIGGGNALYHGNSAEAAPLLVSQAAVSELPASQVPELLKQAKNIGPELDPPLEEKEDLKEEPEEFHLGKRVQKQLDEIQRQVTELAKQQSEAYKRRVREKAENAAASHLGESPTKPEWARVPELIYGDDGLKFPSPARQRQIVEIRHLAHLRARTALICYEVTLAGYQEGTVSLHELVAVLNKLRDVNLASASTPEKEKKVLLSHLERTKSLYEKVKNLSEVGARGGEPVNRTYIELAYQEAQLNLLMLELPEH